MLLRLNTILANDQNKGVLRAKAQITRNVWEKDLKSAVSETVQENPLEPREIWERKRPRNQTIRR